MTFPCRIGEVEEFCEIEVYGVDLKSVLLGAAVVSCCP